MANNKTFWLRDHTNKSFLVDLDSVSDKLDLQFMIELGEAAKERLKTIMANNSIKAGTKVRWYDQSHTHVVRSTKVKTGKIVAQSRQGDEVVIVEWDAENFPVSIENVDDLIEIE